MWYNRICCLLIFLDVKRGNWKFWVDLHFYSCLHPIHTSSQILAWDVLVQLELCLGSFLNVCLTCTWTRKSRLVLTLFVSLDPNLPPVQILAWDAMG